LSGGGPPFAANDALVAGALGLGLDWE